MKEFEYEVFQNKTHRINLKLPSGTAKGHRSHTSLPAFFHDEGNCYVAFSSEYVGVAPTEKVLNLGKYEKGDTYHEAPRTSSTR